MSEHAGKVVLVTGAAGNLGAAVAQAFSARGASLALIDLNEEGLNKTHESLSQDAVAAIFPTNLIEPESVSDTISAIIERFAHIDVVANIAGGFTMGPMLHESSDKDWNFMFDLNARSVFNSCRASVPHLLANGSGRIINISARAAKQGKGRMGTYCASKAS